MSAPKDFPSSSPGIIRGTNDDALTSKAAAVKAGYLQDPFTTLLARRGAKRSPLINRGTYIRCAAIDALVSSFLSLAPPGQGQVVSLGAGSDTRFLNLTSNGTPIHAWFEVDFPEITKAKIAAIIKHPQCVDVIGDYTINTDKTSLTSSHYTILPGDLCHMEDAVGPSLLDAGLDPRLPTLFILECVLAYIPAPTSASILAWSSSAGFSESAILLYDPISPSDAFGAMMISNLRERGIELPGVWACADTDAIKRRFIHHGWNLSPHALTIDYIHEQIVSQDNKLRMARLEMLDEIEEFRMLTAHYVIAWAHRGVLPFWSDWSDWSLSLP